MRQQVTRSAVLAAVFLGLAGGLIVLKHFMTNEERPGAKVMGPAESGRQPDTHWDARSTAESPDRAVRDVTPQGVSRVFMPPPAPGGKRIPTAPSIRISQAGVAPNGEIRGEGGTVRLYGVAFPDGKKVCTTSAGERWGCGRRAYIALHNKVAAAEIGCEPRSATDPPEAECHIGEVNLAAWLIAEGLAQLAPDITDKHLVAADAAARTAKRGLWSDSSEAAATSAQPPPP